MRPHPLLCWLRPSFSLFVGRNKSLQRTNNLLKLISFSEGKFPTLEEPAMAKIDVYVTDIHMTKPKNDTMNDDCEPFKVQWT